MWEVINLVNNFKVQNVIFNCGKFSELEQNSIKVLDNKIYRADQYGGIMFNIINNQLKIKIYVS